MPTTPRNIDSPKPTHSPKTSHSVKTSKKPHIYITNIMELKEKILAESTTNNIYLLYNVEKGMSLPQISDVPQSWPEAQSSLEEHATI